RLGRRAPARPPGDPPDVRGRGRLRRVRAPPGMAPGLDRHPAVLVVGRARGRRRRRAAGRLPAVSWRLRRARVPPETAADPEDLRETARGRASAEGSMNVEVAVRFAERRLRQARARRDATRAFVLAAGAAGVVVAILAFAGRLGDVARVPLLL